MGPVLEPRPPASQGSGGCVSGKYTRVVEGLLELELHSPKEREDFFLGEDYFSYFEIHWLCWDLGDTNDRQRW